MRRRIECDEPCTLGPDSNGADACVIKHAREPENALFVQIEGITCESCNRGRRSDNENRSVIAILAQGARAALDPLSKRCPGLAWIGGIPCSHPGSHYRRVASPGRAPERMRVLPDQHLHLSQVTVEISVFHPHTRSHLPIHGRKAYLVPFLIGDDGR